MAIMDSAYHEILQISRDPARLQSALSYLDQFLMTNNERPPYDLYGSVAVIPCIGAFSQRSNWWSWRFNGDRVQFAMTHALQNPAVKSVVLDIDSPGGTVAGSKALADYIFEARSYKKKIVGVANELCASAALWIGTACHELVTTATGRIGSLGVIQARLDVTKNNAANGVEWFFFKSGANKTFGHPETPMTDPEKVATQATVNTYFEQFLNGVARNRDVTPEEALKEWGNAQVWIGQAAVDVGLADRVSTLDGEVAKLSGQPTVNVSEQGNPDNGEGISNQRTTGSRSNCRVGGSRPLRSTVTTLRRQ